MGPGSVATVFVGVLDIKTVSPLAAAITICSMVALAVAIISKKFIQNRARVPMGDR